MTDSGGRSTSLSRDKTIPAAPQAAHVEKKYSGWNVLWQVLRRQTFKHGVRFLFCSTVHPSCTYWVRFLGQLQELWDRQHHCPALQRGPPSSSRCFSHWILNDELINFPTIDLDWMMSFSANHCAAALSHAQTQLAVGPSQQQLCSWSTAQTPVWELQPYASHSSHIWPVYLLQ